MTLAVLVLRQLAVAGALASTALAAGSALPLRARFRRCSEEWAFRSALGLGTLGTLFFITAAAGALGAASVAAIAVGAHALGWRRWRGIVAEIGASARRHPVRAAAALLVAAPAFVAGLYPPTAFDETMYHMPYIRALAGAHRLVYLPDLRFPIFPQIQEIIGAAIETFAGDVATHVLSLVEAAVASVAIFAAGSRWMPSRASLWAAAAWAGSPLVCGLASTAMIDLGFAMFAAMAVLAWEIWREERDPAWLAAAGALAGFSAGAKYLGLFFIGAIVVLSLLDLSLARRRRLFAAASAAAIAALLALPWYARIYAKTGNPVFPFLGSLFGANAWTSDLHGMIAQEHPQTLRLLVGRLVGPFTNPSALLSFLAIPFRLSFSRAALKGTSPLSPIYVVAAPLAAAAALCDARARRLFGVALVFTLVVRDFEVRFLLAPAVLCLLAATPLAERLVRRLPRLGGTGAGAGLALLLAAPAPLYGIRLIHRDGAVPVSQAARERYVSSRIPAAEALFFLNRTEGTRYTVYCLYGENLRDFARGRCLGDWIGPARYDRVFAEPFDGEELYRRLRALGCGWLLVNRQFLPAVLPSDAGFARRFTVELRRPTFTLYRLAD